MIKVCTVYFEGLYTPDYVSRFYTSLKRNTTIPFEFICLSDTEVEADVVLPYNKYSDIKLHWHKLKFFSPHFGYQKPGDEIVIMDIDQVMDGWRLKRLPRIDRDILRLAYVDINFLSTPVAVACDEAVNLANKYSDIQGRKFINGVLRRLQRIKL